MMIKDFERKIDRIKKEEPNNKVVIRSIEEKIAIIKRTLNLLGFEEYFNYQKKGV